MELTIEEKMNRIAIIKIGWSKSYDGSDRVKGSYSYLMDHQGYEAFNFKIGPDGQYYGYLPPSGKKMLLNPPEKEGWLLVFVSAPGGGGLKVVGWYDSANFLSHYEDRPEYKTDQNFQSGEERFKYCLVTKSAYLIPEERRKDVLPLLSKKLRRSPILYVRGGRNTDRDREELAKWAEFIVQQYKEYDETLDDKRLNYCFPDPEKRKAIEKAAIDRTISHLKSIGFNEIEDMQAKRCGYDLRARNNRTRETLLIEVKGTSMSEQRFYITRNEWGLNKSNWRLSIVTEALADPSPTPKLLTKDQVIDRFKFEPLIYECSLKGRHFVT